jgi:hypothetical protein
MPPAFYFDTWRGLSGADVRSIGLRSIRSIADKGSRPLLQLTAQFD